MKNLFITTLLLMTSLSHAELADQPKFQIDQQMSKISLEGTSSHLKGTIEIKEVFENSKIKINSDSNAFEERNLPVIQFISTEIVGEKDRFTLTGNLTINGITKLISFDSYYLGFISDGYGHDKAGILGKVLISAGDFNLQDANEILELTIKLFGARPSLKTSAVVEMVDKIAR